MVCTPHMLRALPHRRPRGCAEGLRDLREALDEAGHPARDPHRRRDRARPPGRHERRTTSTWRASAAAGGGCCWRCPSEGWPLRLPEILRDLEIRGYRVILAHPERVGGDPARPRPHARHRGARGAGAADRGLRSWATTVPAARRAAAAAAAPAAPPTSSPRDAHSAGPWRPPCWRRGCRRRPTALDVDPQALRWMVRGGPGGGARGARRCGRPGSRRREGSGRASRPARVEPR